MPAIKYKSFILILLVPIISFCQVKEVNPPNYIKTINFKGNTPESTIANFKT